MLKKIDFLKPEHETTSLMTNGSTYFWNFLTALLLQLHIGYHWFPFITIQHLSDNFPKGDFKTSCPICFTYKAVIYYLNGRDRTTPNPGFPSAQTISFSNPYCVHDSVKDGRESSSGICISFRLFSISVAIHQSPLRRRRARRPRTYKSSTGQHWRVMPLKRFLFKRVWLSSLLPTFFEFQRLISLNALPLLSFFFKRSGCLELSKGTLPLRRNVLELLRICTYAMKTKATDWCWWQNGKVKTSRSFSPEGRRRRGGGGTASSVCEMLASWNHSKA